MSQDSSRQLYVLVDVAVLEVVSTMVSTLLELCASDGLEFLEEHVLELQ